MTMEMRTRRGKEGSSMRVDERKESRKRQRANDAEDESEAEHCVTQLMRGVVEGELMQSSSGSEYEPKIEEEGEVVGKFLWKLNLMWMGKCGRQWGPMMMSGWSTTWRNAVMQECKVGGRPMEGRGHRRWKGELS